MSTTNIRERLDRGVANSRWWEWFPDFSIQHIQHSFSDHCPVNVETRCDRQRLDRRAKLVFHFDADWFLEDNFESHLKGWWPLNVKTLPHKLRDFGEELRGWTMNVKHDRVKRRLDWNSRLAMLNCEDPCEEVLAKIIDVKLL